MVADFSGADRYRPRCHPAPWRVVGSGALRRPPLCLCQGSIAALCRQHQGLGKQQAYSPDYRHRALPTALGASAGRKWLAAFSFRLPTACRRCNLGTALHRCCLLARSWKRIHSMSVSRAANLFSRKLNAVVEYKCMNAPPCQAFQQSN